jgi:peptide/nickel transport system ATP-binding protein
MIQQAEAILEVKDLGITLAAQRRRFKVVEQISFSIAASRTLGLVGESGSGKSLTAMAILGLPLAGVEMLINGSIRLAGRERGQISAAELRDMRGKIASIIFQDPMSCLNPIMTVGRQTAEAVRRNQRYDSRQTRRKVLELFEEVGLPEPERKYHAYPHQLSGGQQQRVMITIALAGDPMLLIADEPTTALDVTIQAQVLELLRQLQRTRKMAMLFISHDLNLVGAMADHIAVMRQGRILEHGPAELILSNPEHPYTRALLACRPDGAVPRSRLPVISDFLPEEAASRAKPPAARAADSTQAAMPPRNAASGLALRINQLVVDYSRGPFMSPFRAVDHLDLELESGKTLGMVGESGSGKSTVARSIAGLQPFVHGRIEICGRPLAAKGGLTNKQRAKLCQMIMQNPLNSLNPRLKIKSIILEPLRTHGLLGESAGKGSTDWFLRSLMAEVNLEPGHLERYPHQLSGGQRQRVNIARALALNPEVLICDEIVSALDVSVQAQVLNLLLDIQRRRGLAMLFIGHDLNVIRHVSDGILVMHQGRVVESGPANAIMENPRNSYTKTLINSAMNLGVDKSTAVQSRAV